MRTSTQVYADPAVVRRAGPETGRATVDRAIGLLAGRTRCRLADAQRHLLRMAHEQDRDLADVAAGVIALLDIPEGDGPPPAAFPILPPAPSRHSEPWLATVQRILDVLHGAAALLRPVRDEDGRLVDLVFAAVSPEATGPGGRHGRSLIGTPLSDHLPPELQAERWAIYAKVLDTGEPAELPRFRTLDERYSVRAHRLGGAILLSWVSHADRPGESERLASTERLGNLGWGEWNLVSGEVYWSEQLYRIYER
ncbi:ANTAR domain-containing protein, partial [Actinoplanes sp. NPDC051633]|uniref:ANTAR domain-containing protein n=1 Tax=Actinoplanes sp. NPDC051633 TaxID=3155670 RepID=UPI0034356A3F